MSETDSRINSYISLIRLRRVAIAAFWVPPLLLAAISLIFHLDIHPIPLLIGWGIPFIVLWLTLVAKDSCPWCKHSFFTKDSHIPNAFDYWDRTHCANCGEPTRKVD